MFIVIVTVLLLLIIYLQYIVAHHILVLSHKKTVYVRESAVKLIKLNFMFCFDEDSIDVALKKIPGSYRKRKSWVQSCVEFIWYSAISLQAIEFRWRSLIKGEVWLNLQYCSIIQAINIRPQSSTVNKKLYIKKLITCTLCSVFKLSKVQL